MKKLIILLMLVIGCTPNLKRGGNISRKSQDSDQRNNKEASYLIYDRSGVVITLILDENFGNVNDVIYFTNGMMYASPPPQLK